MTDVLTGVPANVFVDDPVAVLTKVDADGKRVAYAELKALIEAETSAFTPDLSTDEGRRAIASLAYKITRTKTAIDDARKQLTEDWRKQTASVNAVGKAITDELAAMAKAVRKPLTEWEEIEEARQAKVALMLATLRNVRAPEKSVDIGAMIAEFSSITFESETYREQAAEAEAVRAWALGELRTAHEKALKAEADREELERLRAEAAERQRVENERAEAEAQMQREADAEELVKEREKAAAERAAQAERDRIAAEQKREADEAAERERDKKHRASVMRAAKEAIMALSCDEPMAKMIVKAIIDGKIPNVTLKF